MRQITPSQKLSGSSLTLIRQFKEDDPHPSLLAFPSWLHPWGVVWFTGLERPSAVPLPCPDPWLPRGNPPLIPLPLPRGSTGPIWNTTQMQFLTQIWRQFMYWQSIYKPFFMCSLAHDLIIPPSINKFILFMKMSYHVIWHTDTHTYRWRNKIWLYSQVKLIIQIHILKTKTLLFLWKTVLYHKFAYSLSFT